MDTKTIRLCALIMNCLILILGTSCSAITDKKDDGCISFSVPTEQLVPAADKTDCVITITITLTGDYECSRTITRYIDRTSGSEPVDTVTFDTVPSGGTETVGVSVYRNGTLLYEGESTPFVVQPSVNTVTIALTKK
jgi:hypothetical protein